MNVGKLVRLNRLFSHPSGRYCSVAVDHFMVYAGGMPGGLRRIQPTLSAIVAARPDAVTMHKGIAATCWQPHAGRVPLIVQSIIATPDDQFFEPVVTPEEAIRLGADAMAVVAFIRGPHEGSRLRAIADAVREAERFELPVIAHIYPRDMSCSPPEVSCDAEDIAWATRCATELGVDVVKVQYCGDVKTYRQIVADCPIPLVVAGGPKAETFEDALAMMAEVVKTGARGATIGRNVWESNRITAAVHAFKAVIHDGKTPKEALRAAGISPRDAR